jgi:hypothetical protein
MLALTEAEKSAIRTAFESSGLRLAPPVSSSSAA